jgi:hypothetical protein
VVTADEIDDRQLLVSRMQGCRDHRGGEGPWISVGLGASINFASWPAR